MEKSNQEIYDKMIECFNIVLKETYKIKNDTFEIIDKNTPNYHNIRKIYDYCDEINSKISSIESRLSQIEKQLNQLINENNR